MRYLAKVAATVTHHPRRLRTGEAPMQDGDHP